MSTAWTVAPAADEQPGGQDADEPAADHRHAVAKLDAREADRVKRDRGDRAERSVCGANPGGDPRAQVARDRDDLGVVGMPTTGTRDQVTYLESGGCCPDLNHAARRAIADRSLLGQLPLHRAERLRDPLAAGSIDHLSDELGTGARLRDQRFLRQLDRRPLGAGADHRVEVSDENSPRRAWRVRHVAYDGAAGPRLEHLFQARAPAGLRFVRSRRR